MRVRRARAGEGVRPASSSLTGRLPTPARDTPGDTRRPCARRSASSATGTCAPSPPGARRRRRGGRSCASAGPRTWWRCSTMSPPASVTSAPLARRSSPSATASRAGPRASWRSESTTPTASRRRHARSTPSTISPGAQQDGRRAAGGLGDDVEAVVQAEVAVDVQAAGLGEHHRVAGGPAAEGVGARVVGAAVGLDLGDPERDVTLGRPRREVGAEQVARDGVHRRG